MGEVNWNTAPEWANWVAMDGDGAWWWFESEPYLDSTWALSELGDRCMEVRGIAGSYTGVAPESSLEQRPFDLSRPDELRSFKDMLEDSDDLDNFDDDLEDIEINDNLLRAAQDYSRKVQNPAHYTAGRKYEVIDVIEENVFRAKDPELGFLQGQVLKYMMRMWDKNAPLEDTQKAEWYLKRMIDKMENS